MINIGTTSEAFVSIEGLETKQNRIPSEILIRVVDGFQRIAWILGTASEGQTFDKRFRPSTDLKDRHKIEWGVPFAGSYGLPVYLGEQNQSLNDFQKILDIFYAIASPNLETLRRLVPDSRLLDKLFEVFKDFLPRSWDNWQIKYTVSSQTPAYLDAKSYNTIKSWSIESRLTKQDEILTIKGDLLSIDFEANKVIVRYPPTHRPIECIYLPEIEDSILENRKGLIEVTGKFILDDEGHPTRLTEVSRVQPIDLSAMTLNKLEFAGKEFVFTPPLILAPDLDDDTSQLYVIEDTQIGISVSGQTREDLMSALIDQIFFLWDVYGCNEVDPNSLTEDARSLREKLRARVREIL